MTSESFPGHRNVDVTCPTCGEVQSLENVRCARCGASLEASEQRKARLARIEQSRREAERTSVATPRMPGFGQNDRQGTRQFFAEMSNQRRRRIMFVFVVAALGMILVYNH